MPGGCAGRKGFEMLGAVLWSDEDAGRAVIWCADQGPLAFHVGPPRLRTGDTVSFEIELVVEHRLAVDVHPAPRKAEIPLPDTLIAEAARQLEPRQVNALFQRIEAIVGQAVPDDLGDDDEEDEFGDDDDPSAATTQEAGPVWPSNVVPFRFTGLPRKKRD
ncbi:hypothetical protein ABMC89_03070 [Sulfitobacter sp. HNIBRBA3233]|uniref:hypothetical protein n=1 Tax=Sulfitobacter marinivivus TaxID=3158558 RepID=UPI0032DF2FD7